MNFSELYKNPSKPVISFEIFPPKTPGGKENLLRALEVLAKLSPGFISVTYGAMGSTRRNSFEIASHIKDRLGVETASHLTCVGSSRAEIDLILKNLRERCIENIVALRGDPPENQEPFTAAPGGYSHANELVEHIRGFERENRGGRFGVAVAGYPEKHIESPSFEEDIKNLSKKICAGADTIITQLFYDNRFYFDYVKKVRSAGIEKPVIPGLMPILSTRQVVKITSMCGTAIPQSVMRRLEECERKNGGTEQVATDICAEQAETLLSKGAPGIHFYVLNRASYVKAVLERLGL